MNSSSCPEPYDEEGELNVRYLELLKCEMGRLFYFFVSTKRDENGVEPLFLDFIEKANEYLMMEYEEYYDGKLEEDEIEHLSEECGEMEISSSIYNPLQVHDICDECGELAHEDGIPCIPPPPVPMVRTKSEVRKKK